MNRRIQGVLGEGCGCRALSDAERAAAGTQQGEAEAGTYGREALVVVEGRVVGEGQDGGNGPMFETSLGWSTRWPSLATFHALLCPHPLIFYPCADRSFDVIALKADESTSGPTRNWASLITTLNGANCDYSIHRQK